MSWARIRLVGGVLKIKPRWHMRTAERLRRVPVLDLGVIIISWWSADALGRYE